MTTKRRNLVTCLVGIVLILGGVPAAAQDDDGVAEPGEPRQERQRLHDQIRERIRQDPSLETQERERMQKNLKRCLDLGLRSDQVEALFPMSGSRGETPSRHLLQWQERVIEASESGLAEDLLTDKLREGRMKGVAAGSIDRAMERLQQHLTTAHRVMNHAVEDGVAASPDLSVERQLQRGMAMNLWRGLNETDLEHLRERARDRAHDGSCSVVDLAAAAETATELIDSGIGHDRSRDMAGAALQQGYSAREMREMGHVVRVTSRRGGPPEEMVDWMQNRIRYGESMEGMVREMMHHGWLGPRDMSGPGGNSPVDNVIGGPGRHGSGPTGGGSQHGKQ